MVTGTYVDADDPNTVIVVMDMPHPEQGQAVRESTELAAVGQQAGAIEFSDGVSYGAQYIH